MAEERQSRRVGLRHVYTRARDGALGAYGFQSVACAEKLEEGRGVLENLVAGFEPPGPGEKAVARQVFQLAGDNRYAVLSSFEPREEKREGNYWAESVVVPVTWLEDAHWDVEAAFAALAWHGPEAAGEYRGWPCRLPPEPLPRLAPGPLRRLAQLREGVEEEVLRFLVRALLGQRGEAEPIFVVERPGSAPSGLERLVLRLPLLLPPPLRVRLPKGKPRLLRLRTRGHAGHLPAADLQGLLARGEAPERGLVVELSGLLPRDSPHCSDDEEAYADWVCAVVRTGDWEALEDFYARAVRRPLDDPLAGFRSPEAGLRRKLEEKEMKNRKRSPSEGPQEGSPPSGALPARTAAWEARHQTEQAVWTLQKRLEEDMRQQLETLGKGLERLAEQHSKQLADQQADLLRKLQGTTRETVAAVEKQATKLAERIERVGEQQQRRLQAAARARHEAPQGASTWRRPVLTNVAVLAVGVVVGFYVARGPGAGLFTGEEAGRPAAPPVAGDLEPAAARAALLRRFQEPQAAVALLEGAPEDWADAAYLALDLRHKSPRLSAASSCAVLQKSLGVGVDGACGTGSQRAVREAVAAADCKSEDWKENAVCHLETSLGLRRDDCRLTWPLSRSCGWNLGEARAFLDLVQEARDATTAPDVRSQLFALNPETFDGVAAWQLDEADAEVLVELASLKAQGATEPRPFSQITDEELAATWESLEKEPTSP